MPRKINIPDVGAVNFPDSMDEESIINASNRLYRDAQLKKSAIPLKVPEVHESPGLVPEMMGIKGDNSTEQMAAYAQNRGDIFKKVAGESLPIGGAALGGIPGALAGALAKQSISSKDPSLGEAAADTVTSGIMPGLIDKAVGIFSKSGLANILASKFIASKSGAIQDVANKDLFERAGQFVKPQSPVLEEAASNAGENFAGKQASLDTMKNLYPPKKTYQDVIQDTGVLDATGKPLTNTVRKLVKTEQSPEVTKAMEDISKTFNKNSVGQDLLKLNKEYLSGEDVAGSQTYTSIANKALSDLTHVRNFKLATGETGTLENLALTKATNKGFSAGTKSFNPDVALNELKGTSGEVYKEAMNPETYNNYTKFLEESKKVKDITNPTDAGMMRYAHNRLILAVPMALLTGTAGAIGKGAASLVMGEAAIRQLMKNPEIAKLTIQALHTPLQNEASPLITNTLKSALRGTVMYVQQDGKDEKVTFDDQGRLTYPQR